MSTVSLQTRSPRYSKNKNCSKIGDTFFCTDRQGKRFGVGTRLPPHAHARDAPLDLGSAASRQNWIFPAYALPVLGDLPVRLSCFQLSLTDQEKKKKNPACAQTSPYGHPQFGPCGLPHLRLCAPLFVIVHGKVFFLFFPPRQDADLGVWQRILNLHTAPNGIEYDGRFVQVGTFPIGIEPEKFQKVWLLPLEF